MSSIMDFWNLCSPKAFRHVLPSLKILTVPEASIAMEIIIKWKQNEKEAFIELFHSETDLIHPILAATFDGFRHVECKW